VAAVKQDDEAGDVQQTDELKKKKDEFS